MIFAVLIFVVLQISFSLACTTFIVGKKATLDGSVMATHSNDGGGTTDPRLVKVSSKDHPEGSMRPIFSSPENYPRYVGKDRGIPTYYKENCQGGNNQCKDFSPIGYIPEVPHTYSYFEATYGIMNEFQVALAESTCSGVFAAKSIDSGGKALLSIDQLSQIAMERSRTAREAVELMGSLAEQYGFFGESDSFEGGSESLLVTDPNEGWVFHILADPTGTSAIWVAARVPDDSVAVVANMFSIREVNLSDTFNFLGRKDMWEIAEAQGLYKAGDPKDFTLTFSDGEYAHKYYSGRRMWGVFNLFSPSANLSAIYGNLKNDAPYPFSVPVDFKVTPQDMMAGLRSWYNGSIYSTSQGLASGAFNSPDRYSGGQGESEVTGSWERTIAIYRSSDSFVVQSRSWLPNELGGVIWFGPGAAHATTYIPVLQATSDSPWVLQWGWQGVYNLSSSYWSNRLLLNIAQLKFDYIIKDIQALQNKLEHESQVLIDGLSSKYSSVTLSDEDIQIISKNIYKNSVKINKEVNELIVYCLFTYADGYLNYWKDEVYYSQSLGYPAWWLEQVGYQYGPEPINNDVSRKFKELNNKVIPNLSRSSNQLYFPKQASQTTSQTKSCILSCSKNLKDDENKFSVCVDDCLASS